MEHNSQCNNDWKQQVVTDLIWCVNQQSFTDQNEAIGQPTLIVSLIFKCMGNLNSSQHLTCVVIIIIRPTCCCSRWPFRPNICGTEFYKKNPSILCTNHPRCNIKSVNWSIYFRLLEDFSPEQIENTVKKKVYSYLPSFVVLSRNMYFTDLGVLCTLRIKEEPNNEQN